jgi:anti-sigma B factor antagonist
MKMETKLSDGITAIEFEGNLDTGTAPSAEQHLAGLIEDGASKLLLDFANCEFISSAGLRILLATAKRLRPSGGQMRICSLNETVQEIFDVSGFSSLLSVFPDAEQAKNGF